MEWWLAVLLGILQGITEWLPISSSGHLAIFQFYFDEHPPILFDIILHLGSLCVILYVMRKEIKEVFLVLPSILDYKNYSNLKGYERMLMMVVVASVPTAIIGFTFDSTIIGDFYSEMHLVGGCLIFTGILIGISKNYDGTKQIDDLKFLNALVVGFFRCLLRF